MVVLLWCGAGGQSGLVGIFRGGGKEVGESVREVPAGLRHGWPTGSRRECSRSGCGGGRGIWPGGRGAGSRRKVFWNGPSAWSD